jgi:hypothetical protein
VDASDRDSLRIGGRLYPLNLCTGVETGMVANSHEVRSRPFTARVAAERLALIFGIVAFPALAIALGICFAILANALR